MLKEMNGSCKALEEGEKFGSFKNVTQKYL